MPSNYKPLSFTTTVRNPARFKYFLKVLEKFNGRKLTNDLAKEIEVNLVKEKIYYPLNSYRQFSHLREKYKSTDPLSIQEAWELVNAQNQAGHPERGFEPGWASRFDTHYMMPKKLGLVYYSPPNILEQEIKITELGNKLLNEAKLENIPDPQNVNDVSEIEQSIFAHCFTKYQRKNPFTAELNHNNPLSLLIRVIKLLNEDPNTLTDAGLSVKEIPIFCIWRNNDEVSLFETIKNFRESHGLNPSDEIVLDKVWEINEGRYNSFQNTTTMNQLPDEFIRKMRITGLFTLRGAGRFLDINKNRSEICEYIIKNYSKIQDYELHNSEDVDKYFNYTSKIDDKFLSTQNFIHQNTDDSQINFWANEFGWEIIKSELKILKNRGDSRNPILRIIPGPTRLEFLTTLAIKLKCNSYIVKPNYIVDDQGLPTSHAPGNGADIECFKDDKITLTEVTLHTSGHQQSINEVPKIHRHVLSKREEFPQKEVNAVYISPIMHQDGILVSRLMSEDRYENVSIYPSNIEQFIEKIETDSVLN